MLLLVFLLGSGDVTSWLISTIVDQMGLQLGNFAQHTPILLNPFLGFSIVLNVALVRDLLDQKIQACDDFGALILWSFTK